MAIGEICSRDVAHDQQGQPTPVGMLTDRDITVSIVAPDLEAAVMLVGDVMSTELVSVREDAGVSETVELMRLKGVRRLPVVDESGALVGLIASDDLLPLLAEEMSGLARMLSRESEQEKARRRTPISERIR